MQVGSPNPMQLVKNFSQVQSDLTRLDSQLTQWQYDGNTYPGPSVDDSFEEVAARLDRSTLELGDLHPDRKELLGSLKDATLRVARNGGQIGGMAQQGTTFGSGWSSSLDRPIESARQALNAATEEPSGVKPEQPNPLKLVKQLSDLQSNLTRWDATLTQWQRDGSIYPASSVPKDFDALASSLYDARNSLRILHPEQTELVAALSRNTLGVAATAGNLESMAQSGVTLGNGWSTTLDSSISNVSKAISVIVDS